MNEIFTNALLMKKLFFLLILVVLGEIVMGQETKVLSRYERQKINSIDASGAFKIRVQEGEATKATVTIPARLEKNLVFTLNEYGKLKLGFEGSVTFRKGEECTADIVCSSLQNVYLSGATDLNALGDYRGSVVTFKLSGASKGKFEGMMKAKEMELEMSGASKLVVNAEVEKAEIELSGASALLLTGKAQTSEVEVSGAAKGDLGQFQVEDVNVEVSGASKLILSVTKGLKGKVSGASKVVYSGDIHPEVRVSGAAAIKKN